MDKQQIIDYFGKYIETYPAYKDDKLFSALSKHLVDFYYDDMYNKIPADLKILYEGQEVTPAVYDKFLIAIGVPEDVINKLSINEKIVFLKSLSDFRRYKGTIEFIRKIGKSFNDTFNVYELFIDYDEESNEWIFKPVLVYKDRDLKEVREKIPYDQVYASVPNFIIPKGQLENQRLSNQIVLPIKSNLLLLDEQIVTSISLMNNLIISTFLKDYKDNYINIYFNDAQYSLNIKTIYFTWYYLASRYYGTNWIKIPSTVFQLQFDDFRNPYSVYDLDRILDEYEALETNKEIDLFYETYFIPFGQYVQSEELTVETLKDRLSNLDDAFSTYVEQRIDGSVDQKKEIDSIINELYTSLLYYRDSYGTSIGVTSGDPFVEYFDYFLFSLPQLTINPEDTTSYMLIYNFKPYHTEMLSTISNVLTYKDKFGSIKISEDYWFHFEMIKYELLGLIEEKYIDMDLLKQSDIQLVSVIKSIDAAYTFLDDIEKQIGDESRDMLLIDFLTWVVKENRASVLEISDFKKQANTGKEASSSISLVSFANLDNRTMHETPLGISDSYEIIQ
jgi:hypothetical protein